MKDFPKGRAALFAAGYAYLNDSYCKAEGCGAIIRWYRTPAGQIMCVDSITEGPHWECCPGADEFRRKKEKPKKPVVPVDAQGNFFEREPGEEG